MNGHRSSRPNSASVDSASVNAATAATPATDTPSVAADAIKRFGSLDDLEDELVDSWREVCRATHGFLVLLREFDLRQGWKACGNSDCAEWLNWRCGISRTTAQEKVRIAKALSVLPQIDEAFKRGDLSYSKVRALTRVASEVNETELLDFALGVSAAQLETYCRRLRNGDVASVDDARRLRESRSLIRYFREDGSGTLSVELPREELELVLKALEQVAGILPEDSTGSLFAKGADALVQMAKDTLTGNQVGNPAGLAGKGSTGPRGTTADLYQVVVHVDASALDGQGGESDLPVATVRRLCCDGSVMPLIETTDRQPLSVGRKRRVVPAAIRRAVDARDRTCTFPGCHHDKWLEYHHIEHWADGGETSVANLTLLCSHHHALIHENGFSLRQRGDGSHYFMRPDGRRVQVGRGQSEDRVEEDLKEAQADDARVDEVREVTVRYVSR